MKWPWKTRRQLLRENAELRGMVLEMRGRSHSAVQFLNMNRKTPGPLVPEASPYLDELRGHE